ncbi:hypothetical protein QG37_01408 [Candidozyma auris]|nr:hypothetical protein QG37_01408 [[Candida] auris]
MSPASECAPRTRAGQNTKTDIHSLFGAVFGGRSGGRKEAMKEGGGQQEAIVIDNAWGVQLRM